MNHRETIAIYLNCRFGDEPWAKMARFLREPWLKKADGLLKEILTPAQITALDEGGRIEVVDSDPTMLAYMKGYYIPRGHTR